MGCIEILKKSLLPREKVATKLTDEGRDYNGAIRTDVRTKTPHPLRSAQHLLLKEKANILNFYKEQVNTVRPYGGLH